MNTLTEIKKRFEADAARRHAAGLPKEQARLVALRQLIRDATAGEIEANAAKQIVIDEEIAHGRSAEAAKACAEAVLAGEAGDFAPRDFGYEKAKPRRKWRTQPMDAATQAESDMMSAQLSAWANGTFGGGL
jgi:hypothetical protein